MKRLMPNAILITVAWSVALIACGLVAEAQTKGKGRPVPLTVDFGSSKLAVLTHEDAGYAQLVVNDGDMPAGAPSTEMACNLGKLVRAASEHLKNEHLNDIIEIRDGTTEVFTMPDGGFASINSARSATSTSLLLITDPCEPNRYMTTTEYRPHGWPSRSESPDALRAKAECLTDQARKIEAANKEAAERETKRLKALETFRDELSKCKPKTTLKGASK